MRKPNVEPTDSSNLFSRIRDVAMSVVKDAPEFEAWLRAKYPPDYTFHHACASKLHLKSTSYLGVMVTAKEHADNQKNQDWLQAQVPEAIWNLVAFADMEAQGIRECSRMLDAYAKLVDKLQAENLKLKAKLKEQSHA